MRKLIVVDIDGTLTNCDHRQHLAQQRRWDDFYGKMSDDLPVEPIIEMVKSLYNQGYFVLLLTGRPEEHRGKTVNWLFKHNVPYHTLIMRPNGNHERDDKIKMMLFDQFNQDMKDICVPMELQFVLEDRDQMVKAWRDRGAICLQVKEGNY